MHFRYLLLTGCCFIVAVAAQGETVLGYVMSSPNYKMQSDSLNEAGTRQTSSNYISQDTIGEISTGMSSTTNYGLYAGYQQMQESVLSLSFTATAALSPSIGGLSGGQANSSTSITVLTDNAAGYTLSVQASTSPALATSSYNFSDYTAAVSNTPDYAWQVEASTSEFGFTPKGSHVVQKYKDNGTSCSTGSNITDNACWFGFSTSSGNIAQTYTANHTAGTVTTLYLRAESGSSYVQVAGSYRAVIIVTVITN